MLSYEFDKLLQQIDICKCENKNLEIKSANVDCPERLYDTFSSFSNQDDGGTIVFGIDEKQGFKKVGVYDAQDLQKKLMELGENMTPKVRPVLSVFNDEDLIFVTAEIPPVDLADRPCFKTAKGRLKGSYVRVGDADKPMTEYEVYSYEAFRKKTRDDMRCVEGSSLNALDNLSVEQYILKRKMDRPKLNALPNNQLYEFTGLTHEGKVTLSSVLLFCPYPQVYFPQMCIIASCVPGTEIGQTDSDGQRFYDSKRIEGTIPEMLDGAITFVRNNMRVGLKIDSHTGKRENIPEYPIEAVRESILNALVHRDYSIHTENKPIQLIMFSNRLEIRNPGGLYGRMTVDQLGKIQPDTRNPVLVTMMETLGQTENRYSGIPSIRRAMKDLNLPNPEFSDVRGEFIVCLYNSSYSAEEKLKFDAENKALIKDEKGLLDFCLTPKTRTEIRNYLNIASVQYAFDRYVIPLIQSGAIIMSIPNHPRSSKQTYRTNPEYRNK